MRAMDLVKEAFRLDVKLIQFADNLPLDSLAREELDALLGACRAAGIALEIGTRGIAPDHLQSQLELAEKCRSPILRVVVDTAEHQPSPDEIVATFLALEPELEKRGVLLAIENHDRFQCQTLVEVLEKTDSDRFGVCLDTVNSFGALEGTEAVVEALAPWAVNLHIKDFVVRRVDSMLGFTIEGRPAGQGQLDIPWLLDKLAEYGRDCNAVLELWPPPEKRIEDTVAKEKEWVTQSIEFLRTLIPD
jgi:sugar phosphate isomerase/epimerase